MDELFSRSIQGILGLPGKYPNEPDTFKAMDAPRSPIVAHPLAFDTEVTSPYGVRRDPFVGRLALHTGDDFRSDAGTPVTSAGFGTVRFAGFDKDHGNSVLVDHGDGWTTRYSHLSGLNVKEGDTIDAGVSVGAVGTTGRSTGPHLHFETLKDGQWASPNEALNSIIPKQGGGQEGLSTTANARVLQGFSSLRNEDSFLSPTMRGIIGLPENYLSGTQ